MSGILLAANTAELALVAATEKTLIQVIAAANHRVKVLGWGIFFDGVSTTAEPVQVRVAKQTTVIGGTPTTNNPVKIDSSVDEVVQTTATIYGGAPTEPTTTDVYDVVEVHPQTGYEVKFPLGQELLVAGGGRLGVLATAPAAVNARVKLFLEE